jgi:hypothetical protein
VQQVLLGLQIHQVQTATLVVQQVLAHLLLMCMVVEEEFLGLVLLLEVLEKDQVKLDLFITTVH